ncbi:serpin family protein [Microlunatus elymi]|uniref:Serpin family protein n=1 Tax=Microlunatus elymi TaxID=2596828 RepID=A0A516Q0J4_9ACTN|nr:serpin family protein [Microlunatus elymi]QDP96912.1 serpin family protein [Microlunatus elymi]
MDVERYEGRCVWSRQRGQSVRRCAAERSVVGDGELADEMEPDVNDLDPAVVVTELGDFSADLYRIVAERAGNLVLSPYSVAAALAMVLTGARGETADQLGAVLHTSDPTSYARGLAAVREELASGTGDDLVLDLANAVWAQQGLGWHQDYLDRLDHDHQAGLEQVDFAAAPAAAAKLINGWVAQRTRDKITELFTPDSIDPLTRLMLVNAAYFKGAWAEPFRGRTRPEPFHRADGSSVEVPMMSQTLRLGRLRGDRWQGARLDFAGGRFAMALLLPDPDVSLDGLEKRLTGRAIGDLRTGWDRGAQTLLKLPRWRFRLRTDLDDHLRALGLTAAFDLDRADFSLMADEELAIGTVVQEAYVAVDEEGAEAAAATGVAMVARASLARPEELIFDRPFLFVIFEQSLGLPLFIGRVADPSSR